MTAASGDRDQRINRLVELLNEYKFFIEFDLIFRSHQDFLYRQKGQLKLDNTVIEEFLPHLITRAVPQLADGYDLGPRSCFSSLYFGSSLNSLVDGGAPQVRRKDQDFAVARTLFIKTSHNADFSQSATVSTHLGLVCAECKTNLDKTMFQEACATSHDVKSAVPGAKYFLLCEWLDMTPVSTAATDIDEVLILRKSKRLGSNVRSKFSTLAGRDESAKDFELFLRSNPFSALVFRRLVDHVESMLNDVDPGESDVLAAGFF